ncbi:hypothetical protein ACA910_010488 [Epithemia clementina (nom. ined.)]
MSDNFHANESLNGGGEGRDNTTSRSDDDKAKHKSKKKKTHLFKNDNDDNYADDVSQKSDLSRVISYFETVCVKRRRKKKKKIKQGHLHVSTDDDSFLRRLELAQNLDWSNVSFIENLCFFMGAVIGTVAGVIQLWLASSNKNNNDDDDDLNTDDDHWASAAIVGPWGVLELLNIVSMIFYLLDSTIEFCLCCSDGDGEEQSSSNNNSNVTQGGNGDENMLAQVEHHHGDINSENDDDDGDDDDDNSYGGIILDKVAKFLFGFAALCDLLSSLLDFKVANMSDNLLSWQQLGGSTATYLAAYLFFLSAVVTIANNCRANVNFLFCRCQQLRHKHRQSGIHNHPPYNIHDNSTTQQTTLSTSYWNADAVVPPTHAVVVDDKRRDALFDDDEISDAIYAVECRCCCPAVVVDDKRRDALFDDDEISDAIYAVSSSISASPVPLSAIITRRLGDWIFLVATLIDVGVAHAIGQRQTNHYLFILAQWTLVSALLWLLDSILYLMSDTLCLR